MIIFTPIHDIPDAYLEWKNIKQVIKYNLSSYYNDAPTLNYLIPSFEHVTEDVLTGDKTSPEFDKSYYNYVVNNDSAFLQMMNLVLPVFMDPNVLIQVFIQDSPFRTAVTESLIKIIQWRYGYNCYIINEVEDFLAATESDFSVPGLCTMDADVARWRLFHLDSSDYGYRRMYEYE